MLARSLAEIEISKKIDSVLFGIWCYTMYICSTNERTWKHDRNWSYWFACYAATPPPSLIPSLTEKIGLSAMVSRQKGHEGQRLGHHSKSDVCCHVFGFLLPVFKNSFDCCFSRLNLRQEAKTRFNERLAQSLKRFNGFWSSHCNEQWLNTTSFKIIRG